MFVPALLLAASFAPPTAAAVEIAGDAVVGGLLTFTLAGPEVLSETGDPNPFVDYTFSGTFIEERGDVVGPYLDLGGIRRPDAVPGYFAADGNAGRTGAEAGDRWRVHYRPTVAGAAGSSEPTLRYRLELRRRDGAVVAGAAGSLAVAAAAPEPEGAADLRVRGPLIARDGRLFLRGANAPFYKIGANSPENLLAHADFDGTRPLPRRDGLPPGELHRYEPHVADWNEGDPAWRDGKGKGLIGALNYLAGAGVNAVYFLTYNVAGDGRDVWPHAATEGQGPDDRTRFDCSKLDQWEVVFAHAQRLGIVLHVVLTETENESLFENRDADLRLFPDHGFPGSPSPLGGAPFADTRKLYYRELVARFAHHPGLVWNLGEEQGGGPETGDGAPVSGAQLRAFAAFIKDLDPRDRPIVVHTHPPDQNKVYLPLLGSPHIDGVSLQLNPMERSRGQTLAWRARSAAAGRPWFVCLDEIGPWQDGTLPDDAPGAAENRRRLARALWANLLSGGSGMEFYFGYKHPQNDLNAEDFRSRAELWRLADVARRFAEREGLHEYAPARDLFDAPEVFAAVRPDRGETPGAVLVYVPAGRKPFVPVGPGERAVRWFDVEQGGDWQIGPVQSVTGPAAVDPGAPPGRARDRDWVLKIGG